MSFTLAFGQEGNCATAQVVWSVDGKTYRFRSDNNFVAWISTIFTVADVVASSAVNLISSKQSPPVQGGSGNLFATYSLYSSPAGNARNSGAVDLQQLRNNNNQVASGLTATIGGGRFNRASSQNATVGGGGSNTASGQYNPTVSGGYNNTASGYRGATVGGGTSNTASGYYATVGGGKYNTAGGGYNHTVGGGSGNTASSSYGATVGGGEGNNASDVYCTIAGGKTNVASENACAIGGGRDNTASAYYAVVCGGVGNSATGRYSTVIGGQNGLASRYGMVAHASGDFSTQGDAQAVEFVARNSTTGATTAVLFLNGTASNRFTIRNNTVLSGICTISGFSTTGAKVGLYQRSISIKNVAGTTTLVHSSTISTDHEDDATWNVTITADNANDSLEILCLGSAGDTVRWVAVFRGLEIAMP